MRQGQDNDPSEVKALQTFFNQQGLGSTLPVTGYYGPLTAAATDAFQIAHSSEVLAPWVPYGLPTAQTPTAYVYKTTQREINLIYCPSLTLPEPELP